MKELLQTKTPNMLFFSAHYLPETAIAILESVGKHHEILGNEMIIALLIRTDEMRMDGMYLTKLFIIIHSKQVARAILEFMGKLKNI